MWAWDSTSLNAVLVHYPELKDQLYQAVAEYLMSACGKEELQPGQTLLLDTPASPRPVVYSANQTADKVRILLVKITKFLLCCYVLG